MFGLNFNEEFFTNLGFKVEYPFGAHFDSILVRVSYGEYFSEDIVLLKDDRANQIFYDKYKDIANTIKRFESLKDSINFGLCPRPIPYFLKKDKVFVNLNFQFHTKPTSMLNLYSSSLDEFFFNIDSSYIQTYIKNINWSYVERSNNGKYSNVSFITYAGKISLESVEYNIFFITSSFDTYEFKYKDKYYFVNPEGKVISDDRFFTKLSILEDIEFI